MHISGRQADLPHPGLGAVPADPGRRSFDRFSACKPDFPPANQFFASFSPVFFELKPSASTGETKLQPDNQFFL
jgi:hypothetical protein